MNKYNKYYIQRKVYSIYILILFLVIPFFIKDFIEDNNYKKVINYCNNRAHYSMFVFDSIRHNKPLGWFKDDWYLYPQDYNHYEERMRWWDNLRFEVNGLISMGMLSFRIKEAIYETCISV